MDLSKISPDKLRQNHIDQDRIMSRDIDLVNAIGNKVRFYHYSEFGRAEVEGKLIEVIKGSPFDHCRAKVDDRFSNLPETMTFSANDIINRMELISQTETK